MRKSTKIFLILTICYGFSCNNKSKPITNEQPVNEIIWIDFLTALENDDIEYLSANSLDSIRCAECNLPMQGPNEYYPAYYIFKNPDYIKKLMHLNSLSGMDFSTYQDEERIFINYKVDSKMAEEGGYNLIFTFLRTINGFRFEGMVVT